MAYFRCDSNSVCDGIGNIDFPGTEGRNNLYNETRLPGINPAWSFGLTKNIEVTIPAELSDRVTLTGKSSWGNDDHTIINIVAETHIKIGANQGDRYYIISVSGFSIT